MRIGLITTINTNIGDDFIREGICRVLRHLFGKGLIDFVLVNKHIPYMVYPSWHPIHLRNLSRYLPRGGAKFASLVERIAPKLRSSLFDKCDMIIQCGAPVFWPGCHRCEWAEPLWHSVVGRLSTKVPVLNIAAGSCYPWKLQPQSIENPNDVQYLKAILGYCRVTTVRDVLAQSLSTSLGFHTPLIPCSAFVAHEGLVRRPARKKTIVLNYMHQGGHYDWGQNIDAMRWQHTMRSLVQRLKLRHDVVWLCHNEREYHLAGTIDSELKRIWPKNTQEYVSLLGEVDVALCNRLHASVVLAGLGVPSIAVGTDTRMLMVEALGLPAYYVEETNVDELEQQLEWMLCNSHVQRERLVSLKTDTFSQYVQIIKETIA